MRFNCSFINKETIRKYFENTFSNEFYQVFVSNVSLQERNAFVKFATFDQANYVLKTSRQLPESGNNMDDILFSIWQLIYLVFVDFTVTEYVKIEEIAWPIRNWSKMHFLSNYRQHIYL